MRTLATHRRFLAFLVLCLLPLASACGDDDPVEDHEELPEFMELTIGANTIRVNNSGTIVVGTAPTLSTGSSVPVTARFLADDGDVLSVGSEFELRGASAAPGVITFASTGPLSGTLTPVSAGQTTIAFELFHTEENHEDWGPHSIPFTVTAP